MQIFFLGGGGVWGNSATHQPMPFIHRHRKGMAGFNLDLHWLRRPHFEIPSYAPVRKINFHSRSISSLAIEISMLG